MKKENSPFFLFGTLVSCKAHNNVSPTSEIPVVVDIMAVDKVKVVPARVTLLSWSLDVKSLVNSR